MADLIDPSFAYYDGEEINIMKFVDLLSIIDANTELVISDADGKNKIELFADNSFLKLFDDSEITKIEANILYVRLSEGL